MDTEIQTIESTDQFILVGLSVPMQIDDYPADKKPPISPLGEIPASESAPRFMYWTGKEWAFEIGEARRFNWMKSAQYWAGKLAAQAPKKFRYLSRIRIAKLDSEGSEIVVPKRAEEVTGPVPFSPADRLCEADRRTNSPTFAERREDLQRIRKTAPLGIEGRFLRPPPLAREILSSRKFATGPVLPPKPEGA